MSPDGVEKPSAPRQVDLDHLLSRIGSLKRLTRLLPLFSKNFPIYVEALRQAYEKRDGDEFRKAAHAVRGSLSMLAADGAAGLALELEQAGADRGWEESETKITRLEGLCGLVEAEMNGLLSQVPVEDSEPSSVSRHTGRILVIEDDETTRVHIREALERAGHRVWEAESAEQGFDTLSSVEMDCVLMDVLMQGVDGFEACRTLKSQPATRMLPVLLVTALEAREDRLRGVECGADDFITKPVDIAQLLLRISNAVRSKQLYDELQANFAKLQELERLRDNLTHMLVHDLRTPLTGIFGYASILKKMLGPRLSSAEQEYFGKLQQLSQNLVEMVSSILDVNRLETSEMPLKQEWISAEKLVPDAIAACPLQGGREVSLEGDLKLLLWCDPALMHRVLVNLLANALKFTPLNSSVRVSVQRVNEEIEIRITDHGPGIQADLLERVFDKFGQDEKHRTTYSTGLGLTFCKLVMQRQGGSIGVDSEPGRGCQFYVRLPLAGGEGQPA